KVVGGNPVLVVDQAAENLCLAVLQPQYRRRAAPADLIGNRTRWADDLLRHRTDFQPQLDRHLVAGIDDRLYIQLEADIEVLHVLGEETGRGRGGGDHRHAIADADLRLLPVVGADARVGQQVGAAGVVLQIQRQRRNGRAQVAGVQVAQVLQ